MIRTNPTLVSEIIEVDPRINLDPFILSASVLVDEIEQNPKSNLTPERLELIERWLAAHFYAMRDPRAETEKAGSVGVTYQSKVDLNLSLSHYGQMAIVLDTTGTLRLLSEAGRVQRGAFWLGREEDRGDVNR